MTRLAALWRRTLARLRAPIEPELPELPATLAEIRALPADQRPELVRMFALEFAGKKLVTPSGKVALWRTYGDALKSRQRGEAIVVVGVLPEAVVNDAAH